MGYLVFALTVLFLPFLPAGATVPRWGLLAVAVPAIVLWKNVSVPAGAWALATYVTVTLLLSGATYSGMSDYCLFWILLGAFCVGRAQLDLRPVFIGAALGLWANSVAIILAKIGAIDLPHTSAHPTLFMNENSSVEAAAVVVVALVVYRLWWLLPGLLPTLFLGERAPVLALGAVGCVAFWRKSKLGAVACVVAAILFIGYMWLSDRFHISTWEDRLSVWRDVIPNLTVLGHGIGSFAFDFSALQVHTNALTIRYDHPHSEPLQIIYEFGVVGVLFIALLVRRMGRLEPDAAWYALAVFLVEGCFSFPLYMPVTGFLAALCAGYISRPGAALRRYVPAVRRGLQNWHGRAPHRAF